MAPVADAHTTSITSRNLKNSDPTIARSVATCSIVALFVVAPHDADPLAMFEAATPMCLAGDYVEEGWLNARIFAVAVPLVGWATGWLSKSGKSNLAKSCAAAWAKILHANDGLLR